MAEIGLRAGLDLLGSRTRLTVIACWVVIVTFALAAVGQILELTGTIDFEQAGSDVSTFIFAIVYIISALAYYVSVVLVGMWIYRAHANLFAADLTGLEYSPGWSVGWFFVPIACLFKPFQAMRELWNASHGAQDNFDADAEIQLNIWWGAFVVGGIADWISFRLTLLSDQPTMGVGLVLSAIGSALSVVSAWYLIQIMQEVERNQRTHFAVAEFAA